MEIIFGTSRLAKLLNSEKELTKKYGNIMGRKVMRRMKLMKSAPTLKDVPHQPPESRHALGGNRDGQFAVTIEGKERIIFAPANDPLPEHDRGGIDITRVTRIEIIEVGDYH